MKTNCTKKVKHATIGQKLERASSRKQLSALAKG